MALAHAGRQHRHRRCCRQRKPSALADAWHTCRLEGLQAATGCLGKSAGRTHKMQQKSVVDQVGPRRTDSSAATAMGPRPTTKRGDDAGPSSASPLVVKDEARARGPAAPKPAGGGVSDGPAGTGSRRAAARVAERRPLGAAGGAP